VLRPDPPTVLRLARQVPMEMLGTLNALLVEEFWRAVASRGALSLHVVCHYGRNMHHVVEGIFKAAARALRRALKIDASMSGLPSTKGIF
jgi:imidazoleglycerol-phosphate dehydratase